MKLQELFEQAVDLPALIKSECHEYFAIPGATSQYIYRGMDGIEGFAEYKEPETGITVKWRKLARRKGRQPMSLPQELSDVADNFFQDRFGWKGRSDGVFVTSNFSLSMGYGIPYLVLPVGKTSFIWSPKISDLFDEYYTISDKWIDNQIPKSEWPDLFEETLFTAKYTAQHLTDALKTRHEIMLNCDQYIIIDASQMNDATYHSAVKNIVGF